MEWWVSERTRRNHFEPGAAQSRAELDRKLQAIHDEAAAKTNHALKGFKKSQRVKSIRLNRAMEAELERITNDPNVPPALPALLPKTTREDSLQDEVVQIRRSTHLSLLEELEDQEA